MPKYTYTARDRSGKAIQASIEAPSRKDVLRLLAARGLQPLSVDEPAAGGAAGVARKGASKTDAKGGAQPARGFGMGRGDAMSRLSRNERLPFFQALHDLTSSGMSAGEAVRLLSIRLQQPMLRGLCTGLWERLGEGASLSQAMTAFPVVFDHASINLIQAGEATGSLNDVLSRLITHLIDQKELRRKIVAAMAYPVLMFTVSLGLIAFFLLFLLPRMQMLLKSLGGKLPVSTQLLISLSTFAAHYGIFIIGGLVFAGVSFWRWRQTPAGREKSDTWLLKVPLVGPFIVSQTVLAFSQTLSVLLENGINATEALRMTEKQVSNAAHRRAFHEATERVLEGESLSSALQRTGCIPALALDQLAVGENTGSVVPSLKKIAAAYQKGIADQLGIFMQIVSNGVLMAVFSFVGFIAFAIVSAVFQLSSSFNLH